MADDELGALQLASLGKELVDRSRQQGQGLVLVFIRTLPPKLYPKCTTPYVSACDPTIKDNSPQHGSYKVLYSRILVLDLLCYVTNDSRTQPKAETEILIRNEKETRFQFRMCNEFPRFPTPNTSTIFSQGDLHEIEEQQYHRDRWSRE